MGGYGSGRYVYCSKKRTTDDYLAIDIRKIDKKLFITSSNLNYECARFGKQVYAINLTIGNNTVIFNYKKKEGSVWEQYNYTVEIIHTACTYGGIRLWFKCPIIGCGKRVAILYGGSIFSCRHCRNLAYKSQRHSTTDRMRRRADTIRNRLGWLPGIANGEGLKPKGMHWVRYESILKKYQSSVSKYLQSLNTKYCSMT